MTSDPVPTLSVIIPTYNRSEQLTSLLDVLGRQAGEHLEVLVIDDGSTDGTTDAVAARFPAVKLLAQEHGGPQGAGNLGAEAATGDFLCFLDDDDRPDPEWVDTLAHLCALPEAGIVSVGYRATAVDDPDRIAKEVLPGQTFRKDFQSNAIFLAGTYAVTRDLFREVGGFDRDLPLNHQTDLGISLSDAARRRGLRTICLDAPLITIRMRPRDERFRFDPAKQLVAFPRMVEKHPEAFRRDRAARADLLGLSGIAAVRLGRMSEARRYFLRAALAHPTRKHLGRAAAGLIPALARRSWPASGT